MNVATPELVFELQLDLPDESLSQRAARLIGFNDRYGRLGGQMRLLTDLKGVESWAEQSHDGNKLLPAALADRYPLIIFFGDVGTGKTVTAEAASDALARQMGAEGFLLKLSTRVRGIGHVGEMSTLIADAFREAETLAGKKRFVSLIIDEGDALAFHRGAERAHHEDRVGVNTLIQKIDQARTLNGRLVVILCTNRFHAIDPAILRRAALIEEFRRPTDGERKELFEKTLQGVPLSSDEIRELVKLTGPHGSDPGFTYSDIQTRLIPEAVARAYPGRPLTADDLLIAAAETKPSPTMSERLDQ